VENFVIDPTDVVDLTEAGTIDWVHYGTNDEKNISFHFIGTLQNQDSYYNGDPRIFSWSDGTTKAHVQNPGDGEFSANNPMTLTVIASPTPRVLTLYIGNFSCDSELEVTLGDASVSKVFTGNPELGIQVSSAIHFAAEDTAALNLAWRVRTYLDSGESYPGNVAFAAATLANE
jgi:hypothetical protein